MKYIILENIKNGYYKGTRFFVLNGKYNQDVYKKIGETDNIHEAQNLCFGNKIKEKFVHKLLKNDRRNK